MPHERELSQIWLVLRLTYGFVPILVGADKFLFLFGWWAQYLSPAVLRVLPVSGTTFIAITGVIEIAIGILVLSGRTLWGAYAAAGWFTLTASNLFLGGRYADIGVRDLALIVGALTFARLTVLGYRMELKAALPDLRGLMRSVRKPIPAESA